jgi:hypothetical protein
VRRRADLIAEHAALGAHRDLEALFDALPHSGWIRHSATAATTGVPLSAS